MGRRNQPQVVMVVHLQLYAEPGGKTLQEKVDKSSCSPLRLGTAPSSPLGAEWSAGCPERRWGRAAHYAGISTAYVAEGGPPSGGWRARPRQDVQ